MALPELIAILKAKNEANQTNQLLKQQIKLLVEIRDLLRKY